MNETQDQHDEITPEVVRKVARLARLEIADDRIESLALEMGSILDYIDHLSELDVEGVEPMPRPGDLTNRLADDHPRPVLTNAQLMAIAPEQLDQFIVVPKVIDSSMSSEGES